MLDIESINDCLAFLSRSTLRGDEVPAFTNVVHRLQLLREHLQTSQASDPPAESPQETHPPGARRRRGARTQ